MRERYFLQIDGIEGESTAERFRNAIDVRSWSWGVARSGPVSQGGGGGAGRPQFAEFRFVTAISAASPRLVEAAVTGRHLRSAVLTGVRSAADASGVEFVRYRLDDVTITAVDHDDTTAVPTESFLLAYGRFEIVVTPQQPTGQAGAAVRFGYDLRGGRTT